MAAPNRVTIRDVARAASVSTTTVSDAINGRGRLPESTRARVIEVAATLGYAASPLAQNLRRGRTGAVALYFPHNTLSMKYYIDLAIGAAEEALAHNLALVLLPALGTSTVFPVQVDGVVVSDPMLGDPMLARVRRLGVPVVTCEADLTPGAASDGVIESDHRTAMGELLDHLFAEGARRVALVCTADNTAFAQQIRQGYRDWMHKTQAPQLLWSIPFVSTQSEITAALHEILAVRPSVDAIISVPDGSVTTALQVVSAAGLRVPEDILLASYVDSPELSGLPTPVTAVDLSARTMGRRASELLANLIAGRVQAGSRQQLTARLVIRASTRR